MRGSLFICGIVPATAFIFGFEAVGVSAWTGKVNIERRISCEDVSKRIEKYYNPKSVWKKAETDGIFEAYRVAYLRNRTLHIRWKEPLRQNDVSEEAKRQNDVSEETKRQNDVSEMPLSFSERLSLKEMAVIRHIASDSKASIASITAKTGLSRRTVDRVIASLYLAERAPRIMRLG